MTSNKVIRDKIEGYLAPIEESGEDFNKGNIVLEDYSLEINNNNLLKEFDYIFEPGRSYVIICLSAIQSNIRYIDNNVFVLNEGVKENIRMYRDISDEQVLNIGRQVGFSDDFIIKGSLGHSGKFISAGEYQGIAIARALLDSHMY
ncbi:MAG TPA: hypothetical protein VK087_04930 [Tissierellaceae bacterium]|nr:hypothetical protein [Tissierellaceae bacterium]